MKRRRAYQGWFDPTGDTAARRVDAERAREDRVPRTDERSAWRSTEDRDRLVAEVLASTFISVSTSPELCHHCQARPVFARRVQRYGRLWSDLCRSCRKYLVDHHELPGGRAMHFLKRRAQPVPQETTVIRIDKPFLDDHGAA